MFIYQPQVPLIIQFLLFFIQQKWSKTFVKFKLIYIKNTCDKPILEVLYMLIWPTTDYSISRVGTQDTLHMTVCV